MVPGMARERAYDRANVAAGTSQKQGDSQVDVSTGAQASRWQGGCGHRHGTEANSKADATVRIKGGQTV